jgi:uncharacterized coiled-coil protein SlyX
MTDQPTPIQKKRVIRTRSAAPAGPGLRAAEPTKPTSMVESPQAESVTQPAPAMAFARETDAAAALALVVDGAKKDGAKKDSAKPAQAAAPARANPTLPRSGAFAILRHPAAQAAALLVALGTGWFGAQALAGGDAESVQETNRQWVETAQSLRQGQNDVVRLTGDIKALKVSVEALKESVDRSKADLLTKQSQMLERIERVERLPADTTARLAKLGEQLERVEVLGKDPGVKLASLTERFDRMERQMTTLQSAAAKAAPMAPAPAAAPEGPAQTGSVEAKGGEQKPATRDVALDGWVLHEVYDGVALIEGRNRRLYEVSQGGTIPGVGPVEGIERRGKRWVVVTAKGFIAPER